MDVALFLVTYIIGFFPVILLWLFVHESGHAIAARLVGFRVSSFGVGPFYLVLKDGKYHFKYVKQTLKTYLGRVHPLIHGIHTDEKYRALKNKKR